MAHKPVWIGLIITSWRSVFLRSLSKLATALWWNSRRDEDEDEASVAVNGAGCIHGAAAAAAPRSAAAATDDAVRQLKSAMLCAQSWAQSVVGGIVCWNTNTHTPHTHTHTLRACSKAQKGEKNEKLFFPWHAANADTKFLLIYFAYFEYDVQRNNT